MNLTRTYQRLPYPTPNISVEIQMTFRPAKSTLPGEFRHGAKSIIKRIIIVIVNLMLCIPSLELDNQTPARQ